MDGSSETESDGAVVASARVETVAGQASVHIARAEPNASTDLRPILHIFVCDMMFFLAL
jgi:hypothetical protein